MGWSSLTWTLCGRVDPIDGWSGPARDVMAEFPLLMGSNPIDGFEVEPLWADCTERDALCARMP
jgi:hypothetical protein